MIFDYNLFKVITVLEILIQSIELVYPKAVGKYVRTDQLCSILKKRFLKKV